MNRHYLVRALDGLCLVVQVQRRLIRRKILKADACCRWSRPPIFAPNGVLVSRSPRSPSWLGLNRLGKKTPATLNLLQPTEFGSDRRSTIYGGWSIRLACRFYMNRKIFDCKKCPVHPVSFPAWLKFRILMPNGLGLIYKRFYGCFCSEEHLYIF